MSALPSVACLTSLQKATRLLLNGVETGIEETEIYGEDGAR